VGIFAATFPLCRCFAFPAEMIAAESCTMAFAYLWRLRSLLPSLRFFVYDNGCHLHEFISARDPAVLQHLRIVIDRYHLHNHVRLKCHTSFSPDVRPEFLLEEYHASLPVASVAQVPQARRVKLLSMEILCPAGGEPPLAGCGSWRLPLMFRR
jgi:hypothetical protein